jgi:diamine N-acetyltransferase
MIKLVDATVNDVAIIQQLAEKTWWPTYGPILSEEQIRYMLSTIYSENSIRTSISNKEQAFILLHDERGVQGFASYGARLSEPGVFKLHKLYLLPENHGKGYGKMLVDEVKSRAKKAGMKWLDLNVNKSNKAFSFYQKMGFVVLREEDIPIGKYWMNDYVMRAPV